MPKITFVSHDGTERTVEAQLGQSVMQAAMNNLVLGLVADCGGNCSCATCHAYIDSSWAERIPAPIDEERELIDCALHVQPNSRLTCQVLVTADLDGLVVRTPISQT